MMKHSSTERLDGPNSAMVRNKQVTCPCCGDKLKLKRAEHHKCVRAGAVVVEDNHLALAEEVAV